MTSASDKRLFWACFISLITTAFGFIIRAFIIDDLASQFNLSETEKGAILGVGLWPFAISIVLFSLVIDYVGYGRAMLFAFVCHVASAIITICAPLVLAADGASSDAVIAGQRMGFRLLYLGNFIVALGNGTVEAVINPVVATMFSREKTKWLNILHAGWPGGLVLGGILTIALGSDAGKEFLGSLNTSFGVDWDWQWKVALIFLPTLIYGLMMLGCRFPVSETTEAGVSYKAILQEAGILGALVVLAMMAMQVADLFQWDFTATVVIVICALALLAVYGIYTQSLGRFMFFYLLLIMIPLATTELGTDSWISDLLKPEMASMGIASGWVLVYTSFIMMVLRFFAGPIVHRFSPLGLLCMSALVAALGLVALSQSVGAMILLAATLYGFGKTFFWPTMLGVVSEQFPRGGALTLNSIAAVGMLSVGVLGAPILGVLQDTDINRRLAESAPAVRQAVMKEKTGILGTYQGLEPREVQQLPEDQQKLVETTTAAAKKHTLLLVAILPGIMLVGYLLLLVYFKTRGGYKAEVLTGHAAEDKKFTGGVPGPIEA